MIKITLLAFLAALISLIITPIVIKYTKKWNITDKPNHRKVHTNPIPTLGGLAIFVSFMIGLLILQPENEYHFFIVGGAVVVLMLGMIDDMYDLSAKVKFIVQLAVAGMIVLWGGLQVEFINLPFGGQVEFGVLSSVITILWIVGVMNAINFIDGLDGLSAGVSSIALFTIGGMAAIMGNVYVFTMAILLFFSTLGFLRYTFHLANMFMG